MAAQNANVSWLSNFKIHVFLKSTVKGWPLVQDLKKGMSSRLG